MTASTTQAGEKAASVAAMRQFARQTYPTLRLVIGGEARDEHRTTMPVVDPTTSERLGDVPLAASADMSSVLTYAKKGFADWSQVTPIERGNVLHRIATQVAVDRESLGRLVVLESGKTYYDALLEVDFAANLFRWMAEECRRGYGREIPVGAHGLQHSCVQLFPLGPALAVTGWNAPMATPARKLSAALAAGCSVVLKPSELAPASALALADIVLGAGLPPSALSVVFGRPDTLAMLMESDILRVLSFTGSVETGKRLAAQCIGTMKRTVLELGGHAPVVVLPDADVATVVRGAVAAKFRAAGQLCISPTRFLVHRTIYEDFAEQMVTLTRELVVDDPFADAAQMGPVRNQQRVDSLVSFVRDAQQHGATLGTGGAAIDRPGSFVEPTILLDPSPMARVMNEEPFGPLATVTRVSSAQEAVEQANRLPYGLAAYVFGESPGDVQSCTQTIEAGVIGVNTWGLSAPEVPFGGWKHSGVGLEGATEGLRAFQQTKSVTRSYQ